MSSEQAEKLAELIAERDEEAAERFRERIEGGERLTTDYDILQAFKEAGNKDPGRLTREVLKDATEDGIVDVYVEPPREQILTYDDYTHEIDSPAHIRCPNDDECSVGRISLDRNWNGEEIECEYCGTTLKLKAVDINYGTKN